MTAAKGPNAPALAERGAEIARALLPLERLRELLDRSSRALAGLEAKHLVAAHVAVLVEPCLPPCARHAGGAGGDSGAAPGGGESAHVDAAAFAAGAAAAVVRHVRRAGAGGAAWVCKLVRHLQVVAAMLESSAPASHALLRRALALLGGPGLPFLALACDALCRPAGGDDSSSSEAEEQHAAEAGRLAVSAHLRQLSMPQLSALGAFVCGSGPQPLPAPAAGELRLLRMAPRTRLQLLSDIAALIINPEWAATGAGGAAAAQEAESAGSWACWLPPVIPSDVALRRRAAAIPLLQVAQRLAAWEAVAVVARQAGLADGEAAALAEEAADWAASAAAAAASSTGAGGSGTTDGRGSRSGGASAAAAPALQQLAARLLALRVAPLQILDLITYFIRVSGAVEGISRSEAGADASTSSPPPPAAEGGAVAAGASPGGRAARTASSSWCSSPVEAPAHAAHVDPAAAAQAVVAAALCGATFAALQGVRRQLVQQQPGNGTGAAAAAAAQDGSSADSATATEQLKELEALVGLLTGADCDLETAVAAVEEDDARIHPLRSAVWQVLASFLASLPPRTYDCAVTRALQLLQEALWSSGRWPASPGK